MEEVILISYLNDFIFCPVSIYFHKLYGNLNKEIYQDESQPKGTNAHKTIDNQTYSSKKDILQGINVYCDEYKIQGKIDLFYIKEGLLVERKNLVKTIYDGYIFQLYAQYYSLIEMGYNVKTLRIYSMKDNKNYDIKLPSEDIEMDKRFKLLIKQIHEFDIHKFNQLNKEKCKNCIYETICDRGNDAN